MKAIRILPITLLALLVASGASAEGDKPINLSLFPPVQIFDESTSITGLRLGVYSYNADVTGLDVGIVQRTSGHMKGVQWAAVGLAHGGFTGWQNSWINYAEAASTGFQWGTVNYAETFSGFQLSLVNIAENLNGLQIGIFNLAKNKEKFSWLPIVNWHFE